MKIFVTTLLFALLVSPAASADEPITFGSAFGHYQQVAERDSQGQYGREALAALAEV